MRHDTIKNLEGKVTVYMEFVNYRGDVYDTIMVAEFRSIGWAKEYIKYLLGVKMNPDESNDVFRYKVEIKGQGCFYITENGDNEYAKEVVR